MTFTELLARIQSLRILVIGDVMLDHYITGEARRLSPEAPVPVINVEQEFYRGGGAANVALNLAGLGITTELIGVTGQDGAAAILHELLREAGVAVTGGLRHPGVPTIVKTRVIAKNQQLCRIDREGRPPSYALDPAAPAFAAGLAESVAGADAVILSDYAKGVITQPLVDTILGLAAPRKILVTADPKPSRPLSYRGVGLLTPNLTEAARMAQIEEAFSPDDYKLEEICRRIDYLHAPTLLAVTLGAEGIALSERGELTGQIPARVRDVFDISGAGDTVIAVLTAALAAGAEAEMAADLANRAAGLVVARFGTSPVSLVRLRAEIEKDAPDGG